MSDHVVNCPTGLKVKIRKLKVIETKMFTDTQLVKSGRLMMKLAETLVTEIIDPGPYTFPNKNNPNWDKVLPGDLFVLFIESRIHTYGPFYQFKMPCPECKHVNELELDISNLPRVPLAEGMEPHVNAGFLEVKYEGLPTFVVQPVGMTVERRIRDLEKHTGLPYTVCRMIMCLKQVEGVEENSMAIRTWFEEQDADVVDYIHDACEKFECGLDAEFDLECEKCGEETHMNIPFGTNFFSRVLKTKNTL